MRILIDQKNIAYKNTLLAGDSFFSSICYVKLLNALDSSIICNMPSGGDMATFSDGQVSI